MIMNAVGFLAISTQQGAWGRGSSMAEAVKNCKVNGSRDHRNRKQTLVIVATDCPAASIEVYAGVTLSYELPPDYNAMRFEVEA